MRDYRETLDWYKTHQTAREIGFNPDGMCLKVCRTARDIGPDALTAREASEATPEKYRIHNVRDLRRTDVLYFDDLKDANTAGHVVTMIGRVKGFDWDDLNDVLCETNSVKSGELVVVRATYFLEHWGDPFVFGAKYLNGMVLDRPGPKQTRVERFKRSGPMFDVHLLDRAISQDGRIDLKPAVKKIDQIVSGMPDDKEITRVSRFKEKYAMHRVLNMTLLNEAVSEGDRKGAVKNDRDALRAVIKSLALVRD